MKAKLTGTPVDHVENPGLLSDPTGDYINLCEFYSE